MWTFWVQDRNDSIWLTAGKSFWDVALPAMLLPELIAQTKLYFVGDDSTACETFQPSQRIGVSGYWCGGTSSTFAIILCREKSSFPDVGTRQRRDLAPTKECPKARYVFMGYFVYSSSLQKSIIKASDTADSHTFF